MATVENKKHVSEKSKQQIADQGKVRAVAEAMVHLPAEVDPPILGSRTRIWKQDPSVTGLNLPRDVYIHGQVNEGPSDSQIVIRGLSPVTPDLNRDFLIDPASDEKAFDAVHTYTIVRQVLTMYQRVLDRKLQWRWNSSTNQEPISVHPQAGRTPNAFYSREEKVLKFFFFKPDSLPAGSPDVYTCRSLDVVAHETGHAILDALKPNWISSSAPAQTGGLHESFGDITSIFTILSQLDLVEYIIAETKADLHGRNILAVLAEQFGLAFGMPNGLRNADNDLKLSEVSNEVHDISQVFTGAIYDILADIFTANRNSRVRDDSVTLYETGQYMAGLVIRAIEKAPDNNAIYADVGKAMLALVKADGHPEYATFIEKHFTLREVLGSQAFAGHPDLSHLGIHPNRRGCCGTMQHPEYQT
ncbi:hypothetical protein [Merismopedia glauca]|uniref:Peptidase M4 domain-containing protein n=1 Tax=Merismopedia glauca CCAP 1448/3 TaxID=1296344 RepID=A0A2T1C9L3_9CYAN|nr:hypothetical protein [Merismopedia glauca]PSB04946.1 hypothetical protein C7B64_01600 [Merismopedia glauca CCAP 1448/3]